MGIGSGYGKVILYNEHFVVYGIPAIASAIDSKTEAIVERVADPGLLVASGREGSMAGDGWVLEDNRPANPGYKTEKYDQQKESVLRVLRAAGFDPVRNPVRITLAGDLKAVGGVGASAAVCVSIARALNEEFGLGFDDGRVNEIAFEGEKAYAGTPSGIDNTASTYGGLLRFQKCPDGSNKIDRIRMEKPVEIVMGNTGVTADTKAAVAGVRERKDRDPVKYSRIFDESRVLVEKATASLKAGDLRALGRLMDQNHRLLQEIEVSHPKLDELVSLARKHGAWGAKMTGGGLGGYMVALTPGKKLQEEVARGMEECGYEALRTSVGV